MYYIYKIENLQNHKIYIGLTNNIIQNIINLITKKNKKQCRYSVMNN